MSQLGFQTIADELFTVEDGQARLIGTRCASCGSVYFPQSASCRNPACTEKHVGRTLLDSHGTLYSWTLQAYRPPAPFRMDDWQPYLIGLVDIDEGLRVLGMLDMRQEEVMIGMRLRLHLRPLSKDEEGRSIFTYCFIPDATPEHPQ